MSKFTNYAKAVDVMVTALSNVYGTSEACLNFLRTAGFSYEYLEGKGFLQKNTTPSAANSWSNNPQTTVDINDGLDQEEMVATAVYLADLGADIVTPKVMSYVATSPLPTAVKVTILGAMAFAMGYRFSYEVYELNPTYWDGVMTDVFTNMGLLCDENGNFYIDEATMQEFYQFLATRTGSETGTFYDAEDNEIPIKFATTVKAVYHDNNNGYNAEYEYHCSEGIFAIYKTYNNYGQPNQSFTVNVNHCTTSDDINHTVNGYTVVKSWYDSDPNNITFGTRSWHYHPGGVGSQAVNWDLLGTVYKYYNWYDVNPEYIQEQYLVGCNPMPDNELLNPFPLTLTAVRADVAVALDRVDDVPTPTSGGTIGGTFPTWENNRIVKTITRDANNEIVVVPTSQGEPYLPVVMVTQGTITQGTDDDVTDVWTSPTLPIADRDTMTDPEIIPPIVDTTGDFVNDITVPKGINPTTPTPTSNASTPRPSAAEPGAGGDGTGFVSIYHPTKAQLTSFSHWFWNVNYTRIDQEIAKIFSNPIESIISLHMIFATPTNKTNPEHIVLGRLDSEIDSDVVADPTIHLTCGSVYIPEFYRNALDYHNTYIDIYLPFIGIKQLDTIDVVGAHVGVEYLIDVLTGCCVAFVHVIRDGVDAILYQFAGSCSVQVPVTGTSYGSVINGLLGSIAGGAVSMGVGAMIGVTNLIGGGTKTAVSGTVTGNAGALAPKKPYIICRRPISKVAYDYQELIGYPASSRVRLSNCSGFTRVKAIHLDDLDATRDEKIALEAILKAGVYI